MSSAVCLCGRELIRAAVCPFTAAPVWACKLHHWWSRGEITARNEGSWTVAHSTGPRSGLEENTGMLCQLPSGTLQCTHIKDQLMSASYCRRVPLRFIHGISEESVVQSSPWRSMSVVIKPENVYDFNEAQQQPDPWWVVASTHGITLGYCEEL